jgi:hypothetical protein
MGKTSRTRDVSRSERLRLTRIVDGYCRHYGFGDSCYGSDHIEAPIDASFEGHRSYAYLRDNSNIGITCHLSHNVREAALWLQTKGLVWPIITW